MASILFIDYDDTLFPTTKYIDNELKGYDFSSLEKKNIEIFELSITLFKEIYIISNAMGGWIIQTAEKHMPNLWKFIKSNKKIFVFSAQDMFPINGSPTRETQIFRKENLFTSFLSQPWISLSLSIGDSTIDRQAYKNAATKMKKLFKNIQTLYEPSPAYMIRQSETVMELMKKHTLTKDGLDVTIGY
jgi:hypothetical protein